MVIPRLKPSGRAREYKKYSRRIISLVVCQWLFNKQSSHRIIDRDLLLIKNNSNGYESMNILHFLGLKENFKGKFSGYKKSKVIDFMNNDDQDFSIIIDLLKIKEDEEFIITEKLLKFGNSKTNNFESQYIKQLSELENTDTEKHHGFARKEQAILRAILFKDLDEIQCSLCHKTFPSEIMIAAHIKPRSKCSQEERLDPNIVMPVCKIEVVMTCSRRLFDS